MRFFFRKIQFLCFDFSFFFFYFSDYFFLILIYFCIFSSKNDRYHFVTH